MPQFLLELGTEELPASAVKRAYVELGEKLSAALRKEGLLASSSAPVTLGTPRRLIVKIDDVSPKQADSEKRQRGPGVKGAFDSEGKPTPALLGFCRGQGVDPSTVEQDGQYTWVTKQVAGRSASEILAEAIPVAIRTLSFDKTMRWGSSKMRFARPIRWILASFDGELVPLNIEGVSSGLSSFGHRFYAPGAFEATSFDQLVSELRSRHVEPDPERRRQAILEHLPVGEADRPEISESLLDENVFLTEWPVPIRGEFRSDFLELPAPVLTTVMAKHEKMFPIKTAEGGISSGFIFVRNSGQDDSVRRGCEWVLNARMNDAKFFFDEDYRSTFDEFLEKTRGIVFQANLGVVYSRSERLARLAPIVAPGLEDSAEELEWAAQAGKYAKADLSTGLVSELSSLQGVIGGIYAKRSGLAEPVCEAISRQYDLGNISTPIDANDRTAIRLIIADQLDKLAGSLGIGLEPSGSSDPYGLRRAVNALIEAAWVWPQPLPSYAGLLRLAALGYEDQLIELDDEIAEAALGRMFVARYSHLLSGVRHDILDAASSGADIESITLPRAYRFRTHLLATLSHNELFVQTSTRPLNIVAAADRKGFEYEPAGRLGVNEREALESPTGAALYALAEELEGPFANAIADENQMLALELLSRLQEPINRFFEETMVMAEDPATLYARLTVANRISLLLLKVGDLTKIVFSGEEKA